MNTKREEEVKNMSNKKLSNEVNKLQVENEQRIYKEKMEESKKQREINELLIRDYLGDGVYVQFDGYHIVLYLDNGYGPHSQISLEPEVLDAFDRYKVRLKSIIEERNKTKKEIKETQKEKESKEEKETQEEIKGD